MFGSRHVTIKGIKGNYRATCESGKSHVLKGTLPFIPLTPNP